MIMRNTVKVGAKGVELLILVIIFDLNKLLTCIADNPCKKAAFRLFTLFIFDFSQKATLRGNYLISI